MSLFKTKDALWQYKETKENLILRKLAIRNLENTLISVNHQEEHVGDTLEVNGNKVTLKKGDKTIIELDQEA
jgi:hypothetical protein